MTEKQPHLFVPCRNNEHPLCPHGAGYGADGEPSIVCQCACHEGRAVVLRGAEALDMLISVYMDGLTTGAATAVGLAAPSHVPDDEVDRVAADTAAALVESLRKDPAAMLVVETEIKERLTGTDSGPKSFKVFGGLS